MPLLLYLRSDHDLPAKIRTTVSTAVVDWPTVSTRSQVIWEDSEELGCGMSHCTFDDAGVTFFRTYVVCRYSPGGNVDGEYLENVNEVVSETESFCTNYVSARGDPHMVGFQEQKFDFTGEDGEWYALIHDQTMDMEMNMRITQPVPEVPEVTYITGLGLSVLGADDEVHTFEITINDPHNLETECSEGSDGPCLADGALTILVDGKEAGVGEVRRTRLKNHRNLCSYDSGLQYFSP